MTFWIIYILVQISILGTALGCFSQFLASLPPPPPSPLHHHKKASYDPGTVCDSSVIVFS